MILTDIYDIANGLLSVIKVANDSVCFYKNKFSYLGTNTILFYIVCIYETNEYLFIAVLIVYVF